MSQAAACRNRRTLHKPLTLCRFVSGPRLAIRAAVIVCALASQHPPPRFDLGSIDVRLLAPVLQLYRQGSVDAATTPASYCELCLSIPLVEEDDPTITLEARWFVDYDPSIPASQHPSGAPQIMSGDFNNTGTVRTLKPFVFDADALGVTNGLHVVEVVLAETAAFNNSSTTLPYRALNPGYSAAVYRFFINAKVDQDASRPLCPSQFPSVKLPGGTCP